LYLGTRVEWTRTGILHSVEVGPVHSGGHPDGSLFPVDCLRVSLGLGKISDGYQHRLSSVQMDTYEVWIRMRQKSLMMVVGNSLLTCKSPFNRGAVKLSTRVLACFTRHERILPVQLLGVFFGEQ